MSKTLVVLAAGIGSRYGGLKQIEAVGPNGAIVIEYSVFDAIRAGFDRDAFVEQCLAGTADIGGGQRSSGGKSGEILRHISGHCSRPGRASTPKPPTGRGRSGGGANRS